MKRRLAVVAAVAGLGIGMQTASAGAMLDDVTLASIEIEGSPLEQPGPLAWLGGSEARTLGEYTAALRKAAASPRIDGVVIRLKDAALSTTQIEELGGAIAELREAGKKVHVYAEVYGTGEVLLASLADEAIIQRGGAVSFPGLHMEQMYLADTLDWIGVEAQLIQVGDYKGANEMMTRSEPSKAWQENLSQLLDSMYENMRTHVRKGRDLSSRELDRAMEVAWWATPEEAVEVGLIDTVLDLPELTDHLEEYYDGEVDWRADYGLKTDSAFDMANPLAMFSMLTETPRNDPKGPTIAVVHIEGAIVDGDSSMGGFFGGTTTGSRTIRRALAEIEDESDIGGVIIRINSPGGSAIASEIIWQGVRRVAEDKPVFVSVGSMAASGGYYIAVSGDEIYVNPSSIVGSIGVVGGKFAMGGLYDLVKINVHSESRGPRADLMNSAEPWTKAEKELIRERMKQTYDLFASRVEEGREGIDLSKTAEGRLFTGDKAIGLKMADRIGSLDDAVADLARQVGYDDYEVLHYPGPKGLLETLEEMFGGFVASPGVGSASPVTGEIVGLLRRAVGPQAWDAVSAQLDAAVRFREEPVQVVLPSALIFR
ncbi:MAG: signal peptide peptidase SppA [Phycisphaerales bacterium JB037]